MKNNVILATAAVVMLACLVGSGLMAQQVRRERDDLKLIMPVAGSASMPPHVAVVTAALGTFRGLAVDALWIRADALQERGEFYEAQTLAQWITTLQPRFDRVWAFQAWNMAYNICDSSQIAAERWGWISRGVNLLRAEGIPLNPQTPNLYFELSWLFRHKISRITDRDHWYYKTRFATDMQEVLGDLTSGKTTAEAFDRFRKISVAAESLESLAETDPEARKALATLESLGAKADEAFMRMLGRVVMANGSLDARLLGKAGLPEGTNFEVLKALREDRDFAETVVEKIAPCLQRRILEDRYHMDPAEMLATMERYGPLDWRHPLAHGVYWTEQGVKVTRSIEGKRHVDELALVRGRMNLLMELLRQGRLELDFGSNRIDMLPDPRFCRSYEAAFAETLERITSGDGIQAGTFAKAEAKDLHDSYEKFLTIAIQITYLYGDEAEARRYFLALRDLMQSRGLGDGPLYAGTLQNFVAMRFADQVTGELADMRQFIDAMLRRGIAEGLGKADYKVFNRFLGLAFTVYEKRYSQSDPQAAYTLKEARLAEFPKLVVNSFAGYLKDPGVTLLAKARAWHAAPDSLVARLDSSVGDIVRQAATDAGMDPDAAFPPRADATPDPAGAERAQKDATQRDTDSAS
jgi:hypothetical protein